MGCVGVHLYHSDATNYNAWNVTIRNRRVTGTQQGVMVWDTTIHDLRRGHDVQRRRALRRPLGGRQQGDPARVTSTGSGSQGFFTTRAPIRPPSRSSTPFCADQLVGDPGLSGGGSHRSIPVLRPRWRHQRVRPCELAEPHASAGFSVSADAARAGPGQRHAERSGVAHGPVITGPKG